MLGDLIYRLRAVLRRRTVERELDDELRLHLEHETAKYQRTGLAPAEARRRAYVALGGVEQTKEACRDVRGTRLIEELAQDVKYGIRQMRINPGFTLVAVLSLTLGIGANTAIFQLMNAVRLRSLPVERAHELAEIRINGGNSGFGVNSGRYGSLTRPIWEEIRREHTAFAGVFAWSTDTVGVGRPGDAQAARRLTVSGEFFDVLGIRPWRGRLLGLSDEAVSCPATVAVVSHAYWQRALGGRDIGGTVLLPNGQPTQVVGVAQPGFFGLAVGESFDIAVPFCRPPTLRRELFSVAVMGRLRPDWTVGRATTQLDAASPAIFGATVPAGYSEASTERFRRFRLEARSAANGVSWLRAEYDAPLWLLLGIAGLVLLIACANLANLLLARASTRDREMAVRVALGASRRRLVSQLLVESTLLAALGGVLGVTLAQVLSDALVRAISTESAAVALPTGIDWRVLLFASGAAVATLVVFGVAPALRGAETEPVEAMKGGGRGLSASRERLTVQRVLVVAQIAVSLVLVVGALLFVRSFHRIATFDPGLRVSGITVMFIGFAGVSGPPSRYEALFRQLLDDIEAIPGVESAATTSNTPIMGGSWTHGVRVRNAKASSKFTWVSANYFRTMGIPVLEGRGIEGSDTSASRRVAVVNQMFVRTLLNGTSPIGQTLQTSPEPGYPATDYEIVGVIGDTKYNSLRAATPPMVFAPAWQHPTLGPGGALMIHSSLTPEATTSAVKRTVVANYPNAGFVQFAFDQRIRDGMVRERLMAMLSGFFGLLAALLATIGLYGVIAYFVARRRSEIGIRLALGARPAQVTAMVVGDAGRLVSIGLVVGVALSLLAGRFAGSASILFELAPHDVPTLIGGCALLAVIAGIASAIPARRAARLDALVALRHE